MFSRLFWIIFHCFETFWKKCVILTLGQFTRAQCKGRSSLQKMDQKFFFQQLNCIIVSYDGVVIINRCPRVRREFLICITYPRNEKKVIWCLKKSPHRFLQKAVLQGGSWNGSCLKILWELKCFTFHLQMSFYTLLVHVVYMKNNIHVLYNSTIPIKP